MNLGKPNVVSRKFRKNLFLVFNISIKWYFLLHLSLKNRSEKLKRLTFYR